jgi:dihydrodipicolinate synthase/N-acetylneuraminate lyase
MAASDESELRRALLRGLVIPAHPLALTAARQLDERRQVALTRYYCDAGAGGVAVGVHTTQFAIRDTGIQLLRPVLQLALDTVRSWCSNGHLVTIAGVCGQTPQAVAEAELASSLGYDAALLSLAALRDYDNARALDHCRRVADIIPVMGFYLQPAVGGRVLDRAFWRAFLEIDRVVAIKVAPFDRYRTLDVVAAVAESGRRDVALYTGNDDAIVADLVTPFPAFASTSPDALRRGKPGADSKPLYFAGGLLGQWAVWTRSAVDLLHRCHSITRAQLTSANDGGVLELLAEGAQLTEVNAALFDPSHLFAGCIPGIHEVLRRQGLLAGRWCLDPHEDLSPGQLEQIDCVLTRYRDLSDDEFVQENLQRWLN